MLRLIAALILLWAAAARAGPDIAAPPLAPSAIFAARGPAEARGALVWLHEAHDDRVSPHPPEPEFVGRMAARGYDIWRYDRAGGRDPLDAGADGLARGLVALRAAGYGRLIVAGLSRGGWIALTAARTPGLADAAIALSPAAFGTRPERRAEAMAAWEALFAAIRPGGARIVVVQLADDPYDPEPGRRLETVRAASARAGFRFLSIFHPNEPTGHTGTRDPAFDRRFGAAIASFADPADGHPGGKRGD